MPPKRGKKSHDPLSTRSSALKKEKTEESTTIVFEDENSTQSKDDKTSDYEDLLDEVPSKKPKKQRERGSYSRYDKDDLLEAVKMVRGKKMSLNMAAKYYNVPKTTICNYAMHNGEKTFQKRGAEPTLKAQEERQILKWLTYGSDLGDPRTKEDLLVAAADVLRVNNRTNGFKNGIPTHHWISSFRNRHKNSVKLRDSDDLFDEAKFFRKFYTFLEKNNHLAVLKRPDAFYFIEDTNFELDPEKISSERRVLLRKSLTKSKEEPSTVRLEDSITVTYGFGADGRVLQQLLIFRESYKDMVKVALADQKLNAKFLFTRTHDGGSTRDTFRCYLERIDVQLSDVKRPIFIFCSETLPHVGIELARWCRDKQIFLISFIPNDISILHSIDDKVFGLKNPNGWKMEIKNYQKENNLTTFTEVDFVNVLKSMNDRIIGDEKIKFAFSESGVFPFDKTKMSEFLSDDEADDAEEETDESKKEKILTRIERLRELSQDLLLELTKAGRNELLLNVKIIEQQLEFIESSL